MDNLAQRLEKLSTHLSGLETKREYNLKKLKKLFFELGFDKKLNSLNEFFEFKALNLSGVSLNSENFLEIYPKKYFQLIAVKKENEKSKNISLAYYGRVDNLNKEVLYKVCEFVIRYRFEKSFRNLQNHSDLLGKLNDKVL